MATAAAVFAQCGEAGKRCSLVAEPAAVASLPASSPMVFAWLSKSGHFSQITGKASLSPALLPSGNTPGIFPAEAAISLAAVATSASVPLPSTSTPLITPMRWPKPFMSTSRSL